MANNSVRYECVYAWSGYILPGETLLQVVPRDEMRCYNMMLLSIPLHDPLSYVPTIRDGGYRSSGKQKSTQ